MAPAAEVGPLDWKQVSGGGAHTCGIRFSGRLYCWGDDSHGQLGDGGANTDQQVPVQVDGAATDWATVSAGGAHSCARKTSGELFCWGNDNHGQLGDGGANVDQPSPVEVAGAATDWTTLSLGGAHSCARKASGKLYCWGSDSDGQLGDGAPNVDQATPVEVPVGASSWASVSAGRSHTCARQTSRHLFCWGDDVTGQVGDGGANVDQPSPVEVSGATADWTSVSAGGAVEGSHTCARRLSGRLYCWGSDLAGQLGDGLPIANQAAPVEVAGAATDWVSVSSGGLHTCARKTSGELFCWGSDAHGQLGNGGPTGSRSAPVKVVGSATNWAGVD